VPIINLNKSYEVVYKDCRDNEFEYRKYIENYTDNLIGEFLVDNNNAKVEIISPNRLTIRVFNLDDESIPAHEVNLYDYLKAYNHFKSLMRKSADEIIFINQNDYLRLEGIWYSLD